MIDIRATKERRNHTIPFLVSNFKTDTENALAILFLLTQYIQVPWLSFQPHSPALSNGPSAVRASVQIAHLQCMQPNFLLLFIFFFIILKIHQINQNHQTSLAGGGKQDNIASPSPEGT